jgi:hypothetical protein
MIQGREDSVWAVVPGNRHQIAKKLLKLMAYVPIETLRQLGPQKMANAITPVTNAAPAAVKDVQPQAVPQAAPANQKAPQPQPAAKAPAPKDTVQISTAAQTALQESRETSTQTAREASRGDRQAARLLAKEAAAKKE